MRFVAGSTARALCEQLSTPEAAECAVVVGEMDMVPAAAGGAANVLAATLRVKFEIASEKGIEVAGGLGLLRALEEAGSTRVVGLAIEAGGRQYTIYVDEAIAKALGVIRS
ncbi:MAG: hypothetical protein ACOYNI_07040 [Acidimicrobiia bacterium]